MFKFALLLLSVVIHSFALAQTLPAHREASAGAPGAVTATPDDKQRRRDELRAALKSQSDDAAAPTKAISLQDRAALREQLRIQGLSASPQH